MDWLQETDRCVRLLYGVGHVILSAAYPYIDVLGKLGFIGAIIGFAARWFLKRARLRAAIRIEVEKTSRVYADLFDPKDLPELIERVTVDRSYRPIVITSDRHVIIGNLTDDIVYMSRDMARMVLEFNDEAEYIDDAVRYMRSLDYLSLDTRRKILILRLPYDAQPHFQKLAKTLLAKL